MSRDEIIRILRERLPELRSRYGAKAVGLFGSYARGDAQPASDVDLLVELDRPPSLDEFGEIELLLSD